MSKKKKNKKQNEPQEIITMLDNAFDEDLNEIGDITDIDEDEGDDEINKPKKKNTFLIGLFVFVMTIIGIYSSACFIVSHISDIVNNTSQKNEFAQIVYPVVICDPATFDSSVKLKNETIISAAAWDIILYDDKDKYETEFDYIIVPEVEIEQHAVKLFGTGLSITHTTISGSDVSFYYDEDLGSYRIPSNPKYFSYSPTITEIKKSNSVYTIVVGYISPTPTWVAQTGSETLEPEKYVEYELTASGNSYIITAIRQHGEVTNTDF